MPPIQLYVIIALLITNILTSGLWLWNRTELVNVKNQLEICQKANTETNASIDSDIIIDTMSDDACQKQLKGYIKSQDDSQSANQGLQDLLNSANKKLSESSHEKGNLYTEINNLKQKHKPLPEMTIDEAKAISIYLNTPVPRRVEQQLLIRTY